MLHQQPKLEVIAQRVKLGEESQMIFILYTTKNKIEYK